MQAPAMSGQLAGGHAGQQIVQQAPLLLAERGSSPASAASRSAATSRCRPTSGQQWDAAAPLAPAEAAGDEPGGFEAVEQRGQRRLPTPSDGPSASVCRRPALIAGHDSVANSVHLCAPPTSSSGAQALLGPVQLPGGPDPR
jgi:hypothetical protein